MPSMILFRLTFAMPGWHIAARGREEECRRAAFLRACAATAVISLRARCADTGAGPGKSMAGGQKI